MKRNAILTLLLAAILAATPALAREGKYAHTGSLGMWNTELFGSATIGGQSFNLVGNGNFAKETVPAVGFIWRVGKLSDVEIAYSAVENIGTINKAIRINGTNFPLNSTVTLKLSAFDLLGHREIYKDTRGWLDFIYGVKVIGLDVSAAGGGLANSQSFSVPLPQFGFAGEYFMNPRWTLYGSFSGFSVNRDTAGGTVKNFDSGVQYRFNPKHDPKVDKVDWFAKLGWKAQYIKGKDNADEVTIDHEGVVLSIVGKF